MKRVFIICNKFFRSFSTTFLVKLIELKYVLIIIIITLVITNLLICSQHASLCFIFVYIEYFYITLV
jgi:hypothetical protein